MITTHNGRVFDRVYREDDRNENYRVRATLAATQIPSAHSLRRLTFLDQGNTSGCTGYSTTTALSFAPNHPNPNFTNKFADFMYAQAKLNDEWAGENYDGSSVLGACSAATKLGYETSFSWAKTPDEILTALAHGLPVVFGTNWYESMFTPDTSNVIKVSGNKVGGHAYCVGAYKGGGDLLRIDNSWGKGWGKSGSAWISMESIQQLLGEDGECAVPIKMVPIPKPLMSHKAALAVHNAERF